MKLLKSLFISIFFLFCNLNFSQNFTENWDSYFSYLNVKAVTHSNNNIYAATENAVFVLNTLTNDIKTITTVNGLSGDNISSIYYSEIYDLIVIGYENGLIEIVSNTDDEVLNGDNILSVINILEKPTIPPTQKSINHFLEYNEFLYISTDFGVSVYNMEQLEFGDTYFIGTNGAQIEVNQSTIFNNFIYVATNDGVRKADLSNTNLVDFQFWQPQLITGNWIGIETVGNKLVALRNNNALYEIVNDNFNLITTFSNQSISINEANSQLVVTTQSEIILYNQNLIQTSSVSATEDFNAPFTSATLNLENDIFIGTKGIVNLGKVGFGLLKSPANDPLNFQEIHPDGPLNNKIFSLETTVNNLWAVFGGYSITYNFNGGQQRSGISNFKDEQWNNIKYDSIQALYPNSYHLSHIAINPLNPRNVFISSYYSGLLEIDNNELVNRYDVDNSSLDQLANVFELISPGIFNNNGDLWVTNSRVDNALNKFSNGQWQSFSLSDVISAPTSNLGFSEILIDNQDNIYIGSYLHGLIGFNNTTGTSVIKNILTEEQNMPSPNVTALEFDNQNQLWIGTDRGIRVFFNPTRIFSEDFPTVNSIIFLEEGLAQELLFQQFITDIEVDGSNNKWIATGDNGLFYVSENGQETIHHFTRGNSPLPSNTVLDVAIDNNNGRVYIGTSKGLVSFESGSSQPVETLSDAFIYPNPVRPGYNFVDKKITIKDISENVNIKITDIEGNLVAEAESNTNLRNRGYNLEIDGGTAFWNGKNLGGTKVASGVYLVMLTDLDSFETKVLKLMVVR